MKRIKKFQQEYRGKSIYGTTASEERLYWLTVEFQSLEGELNELIDLYQLGCASDLPEHRNGRAEDV